MTATEGQQRTTKIRLQFQCLHMSMSILRLRFTLGSTCYTNFKAFSESLIQGIQWRQMQIDGRHRRRRSLLDPSLQLQTNTSERR